nr:hypothetical protein [Enterococcus faecalis]
MSIVGSGGKTSLMWALAKTYRKEAVLVSTTTKIGFPQRQLYDYFYTNHFEKITPNICGITLAGTAINCFRTRKSRVGSSSFCDKYFRTNQSSRRGSADRFRFD